MTFRNKLLISLSLLLITLVASELPYINILVTGRLWIFYVFLLAFPFIPWKDYYFLFLAVLFSLVAILLIFLDLTSLSEIMGIFIYCLLWGVFLVKVLSLIKSSQGINQRIN